MATDDDAMVTLSIQVPRSSLIVQAAPPDLLSQKNVSAVCGIGARQYLAMIRSAPLPVTRVGRLRLVERRAFVEWLRSLGVVPQTRVASPKTLIRAPSTVDPVELLARSLGAEVSFELGEAAAKEVRDLNTQFAQMFKSRGLVPVEVEKAANPELDLKHARRAVKWAAQAIGDRNSAERFSLLLGQRPCPTCDEWADDVPCATCRAKTREAARVPCVGCQRRIDPSKDGLCRRCRKKVPSAQNTAADRRHRGPRRPTK